MSKEQGTPGAASDARDQYLSLSRDQTKHSNIKKETLLAVGVKPDPSPHTQAAGDDSNRAGAIDSIAVAKQMLAAAGMNLNNLNAMQIQNFARAPPAAQQRTLALYTRMVQQHHLSPGNNEQHRHVRSPWDQDAGGPSRSLASIRWNEQHTDNKAKSPSTEDTKKRTFDDHMDEKMMKPHDMKVPKEQRYSASVWSQVKLENGHEQLNAHTRPRKLPIRLQVFHKISGDSLTYLTAPTWSYAPGKGFSLVGNSPIVKENRYLEERPDIAVVVYAHYKQVPSGGKMFEENESIPDPKPARHSITLLSEEIIAATGSLLSQVPPPGRDSPDSLMSGLLESPFPFWYYYRSILCFDDMCKAERVHMRLLTDWIESNYSSVFDEVESQIARGLASRRVLPFLLVPGDVLVRKAGPEVEQVLRTPRRVSKEADLGKVH